MPCSDVTEVLQIALDANDQLVGYALDKRTCGRAVGVRDLLAAWAIGKSLQDVLGADIDSFLAAHPIADETEEFLHLKHFFALRLGLETLIGLSPGEAGGPCAIESISCDAEGTEMTAHIRVDVVTDQIAGCGRCGSCGTRKPSVAERRTAGEAL